MDRHGIPLPTDLGPDPEPLGSQRYEALLRIDSKPKRRLRYTNPRGLVAPHPLAVVPAEWLARAADDARLPAHA